MRFQDKRKEEKFADWTTKEILETDDYWRFQGGHLYSIQQSLIRLLEGYSMDSFESENLILALLDKNYFFNCKKKIGNIRNNPKIVVSIPGAIKNNELNPKYQR